MIEWLSFSLQAWDPEGDRVEPAEFVRRLSIVPGDPAIIEEEPGDPSVRLVTVALENLEDVDTSEDAGAQSEAFAAAIRDGLLRAAAWLDRQPASLFEEQRAAGRNTEVFVGGYMTDDQFELDLPPEFLRACGRLGLTLSICTND